jgi:hypothetical protein
MPTPGDDFDAFIYYGYCVDHQAMETLGAPSYVDAEWIETQLSDPAEPPEKPKKGKKAAPKKKSNFVSILATELGSRQQWEVLFALRSGLAFPEDPGGAAARNKVVKEFDTKVGALIDAEPCTLEGIGDLRWNEDDFVMAPKASKVVSIPWRFDMDREELYRVPSLEKRIVVDPLWNDQLRSFAKKMGLPPAKQFGWMVIPYVVE